MSARGLCNQELAVASKLLAQAASNRALYPAAARQLFFCYQCFLLELAELHTLPDQASIGSAADLIAALQKHLGADADIAELESVEHTDWLRTLRASTEPSRQLAASRPQSTAPVDAANSIKVVEVIDNPAALSAEAVLSAEVSLTEWISRARELNQEY